MDLTGLLARPDVDEVLELRSAFGVMAFHGGGLEQVTDVIAGEVAERCGASYYAVVHPPNMSEHLASSAFDPAESVALTRFFDRVDTVMTVHGYGRRHLRYSLLLGGRNRALAEHVARSVHEVLPDYEAVTDLARIPRALRGQHPRNPVNLAAHAGVQIELPPTLRWHWAGHGWSDSPGVGRAPQVDQLIDALADAVSTWKSPGPAPSC